MKKDLINRLINYRNVAIKMKELGFLRVFSINLADAVGVTPVKVRKDFLIFGIKGNYKGGYEVDYLIKKIDEILGKNEIEKVIVVGVGNLGTALIKYKGFENVGIKIVAGFDIDPNKITKDNSIAVYHLDELKKFVVGNNIRTAILAVPEVAAQRVAEMLVSYGIKGILNFSPVKLKVKDCIVSDVHIEAELEQLIYLMKFEQKKIVDEKE